jgi:hypothetical protein
MLNKRIGTCSLPPQNLGGIEVNMPLSEMLDVSLSFSPLGLIDRLFTLAEQADRAGMGTAAGHLVRLAFAVGEGPPSCPILPGA